MIAMLLMAIILSALSNIISQWLPPWDRRIDRIQRDETLSVGLDRLIADISAAQFVPFNSNTMRPLFAGTDSSLIFVRTAIGPNASRGLDIVNIKEMEGENGLQLARSSREFAPLDITGTRIDEIEFRSSTFVFPERFHVSFAYADHDGIWRTAWQNANVLPSVVRLTVRSRENGVDRSFSTLAKIRVDTPAAAVCRNACEAVAMPGWDPRRTTQPGLGIQR